ncbi:MAG: ABC transporter permease [Clostridiales bacterium]|nr:ABC transporter permease [Clostridiales bacterium]
MDNLSLITNFLFFTVVYSIPLLYGTVGEILTEKSGSLNLGVEGTMAVGGIFGYLVGASADSLFLGMVFAFVFAALLGLLFSFLTVTMQANQNVTGLTITTFGTGLYFIVRQGVKEITPLLRLTKMKAAVNSLYIKGLSDIPIIGKVLFQQNILVYFGIFIALIVWAYLKFTKSGLRLRSIGENPAAADAVGININLYKYLHIITGSGIMGWGGFYMCILMSGDFAGSTTVINGYGWIAIALVIFVNWNTLTAVFGTFLFGLFRSLSIYNSGIAQAFPKVFGWLTAIPAQFYNMLPYAATALVIILASINKRKKTGEPAAIGLNYYREDR